MKGISAIIVVLSHLYCSIYGIGVQHASTIKTILADIHNGKMAVSIFIILSAFTMAHLCKKYANYQKLLIKRYFRLMIPCIIPIMLMVLCYYTKVGYNDDLGTKLNNSWLIWWPQNLNWKSIPWALIGSPIGEAWEWLNVLWMMKYVFLTPFVVVILDIILKNIQIFQKTFVIALCCIVSYKYDIWLINIFAGYALFQICDICSSLEIKHKNLWRIVFSACLIFLYIMTCIKAFNDRNNTIKGVCIVSLVLMWMPLKNIFSLKPFVFLGHISFEIYLLHLVIIYTLSCRFYILIEHIPHSFNIFVVFTLLVTIIISYGYKRIVSPLTDKITDLIVNWIKK